MLNGGPAYRNELALLISHGWQLEQQHLESKPPFKTRPESTSFFPFCGVP